MLLKLPAAPLDFGGGGGVSCFGVPGGVEPDGGEGVEPDGGEGVVGVVGVVLAATTVMPNFMPPPQ